MFGLGVPPKLRDLLRRQGAILPNVRVVERAPGHRKTPIVPRDHRGALLTLSVIAVILAGVFVLAK